MASGIGHRRLRPARFKLELYTSYDIAKIPLPTPIVPLTGTRPPVDGGKLTTLPPELTTTILLHLDLNTLLTLRLINTLYKTLIDSLHPYSLVKQHAPHTLRILHRVQLSGQFPLHQLYAEFRHPHCRTCGAFGPLIFLPTLTRCCNQCLWTRARFQVAPVSCLLGQFAGALTPEELKATMMLLKKLPTLHAFPGSYGSGPLHFGISDETIELVSVAEAERVIVAGLGSRERFHGGRSIVIATQAQTQAQGNINVPHLMVGAYEMARTKWMGMAATDLPYWDAQKKMAESGIYCSPCALQREYENRYEQVEANEDGQQALIWDGEDPGNGGGGPRGDNVAFYLGNICAHFEECELLRKGYVFGMKDGMTRGIGNGADFWIGADGSVGNRG